MNVPRGIADHDSTLTTLCTRPSKRLGTIVCQRLLLLMSQSTTSPHIVAQSNTPTQYQRVAAKSTVRTPWIISVPSITLLKDKRRRSGLAASASDHPHAPGRIEYANLRVAGSQSLLGIKHELSVDGESHAANQCHQEAYIAQNRMTQHVSQPLGNVAIETFAPLLLCRIGIIEADLDQPQC